MAMVQPKSQKARLFITHLLLLLFIAAIMFILIHRLYTCNFFFLCKFLSRHIFSPDFYLPLPI